MWTCGGGGVGGGGGGGGGGWGWGVTHPLFLSIDLQEKKIILCGLVSLNCRVMPGQER